LAATWIVSRRLVTLPGPTPVLVSSARSVPATCSMRESSNTLAPGSSITKLTTWPRERATRSEARTGELS
jgi:hypothetical protein